MIHKFQVSLNPGSVGLILLGFCLAFAGRSFASGYNVEVLVFENLSTLESERFPEDPGRPEISDAASFGNAAKILSDVARRLEQSPIHRLLAHRSWQQPGLGPASAKPLALVENLEGTGTLFGTITVTRRRYLHADVDLWFENGDTLEQVRMQQSRRMRSNELHYLDHPRLGVIIIARPAG